MKSLRNFFSNIFIGGLIVLLPVIIIINIAKWLFDIFQQNAKPLTAGQVGAKHHPGQKGSEYGAADSRAETDDQGVYQCRQVPDTQYLVEIGKGKASPGPGWGRTEASITQHQQRGQDQKDHQHAGADLDGILGPLSAMCSRSLGYFQVISHRIPIASG